MSRSRFLPNRDEPPAWRRSHVVALLAIVAFALALRAPSLAWGFFCDDHTIMLVLEGTLEHPHLRWWSAFDFGGADDSNYAPWWTSPDWSVRFFRPLASAAFALDEALFGRNAVGHHAMGLAWFAALLAAVVALYRETALAPRLALTALAVFAFDSGSQFTTQWLAHRNTVLEAIFLCLASIAALWAARDPTPARIAASFAFVALACLCKESGVSAAAIVAAIWWSAARSSANARLLRIASIAALVAAAAYVVALAAAGFGARSDFYRTPWGDPLGYLERLGVMTVAGSVSAISPLMVDIPMAFPELLAPWMAGSALVGLIVWRWLARLEGDPPPLLFVAWIAVTLAPQAGAFPSDRLLFTPMIGAAPWIARGVLTAFDRRGVLAKLPGAALGLASIALSALVLGAGSAQFIDASEKLRAAGVSFEVPRDGSRRDAFVLQSGSMLSMLSPDSPWVFWTGRPEVRIHPLQVRPRALRWSRPSADEHRFESLEDPFLTAAFERVFLADDGAPSETANRPGLDYQARILRTEGRGVREFALHFASAEAAERATWLTWTGDAYERVEPPPVGGEIVLERAPPMHPLLP